MFSCLKNFCSHLYKIKKCHDVVQVRKINSAVPDIDVTDIHLSIRLCNALNSNDLHSYESPPSQEPCSPPSFSANKREN